MYIRHMRMRYRGFTLVELMVTLAVAAIVITAGVPSFTTMLKNNRMAMTVNEFLSNVYYARSEAIKRGRPVTLCARASDTACSTTNTWQNGYLIFVDLDSDSVLDTGEDQLRIVGALDSSFSVTPNTFSNFIRFDSSALPNSNGNIKFCDDRGTNYGRVVLISATGKAGSSSVSSNELTCP